MNDIFHLYQRGLHCLLEKVAAEDPLLVDLSVLKSSLILITENLQRYGTDDPTERANLQRVLYELHRICLQHFHVDFEEWCARCAAEERRKVQHDPLYPYIGSWQALQDGMLQQFLREKLALQGIKLKTNKPAPVEDLIQRYRTVPLHAYLLYSAQDTTIAPYIKEHWDAIEGLSRDVYDMYISAAQLAGVEDGHDVIETSYILKKTGFGAYSLLPGILFWDAQWNWDFVSFGEHVDVKSITDTLRLLYEHLRNNPTIATVKKVNALIHGVAQPSSSAQLHQPSLPVRDGSGVDMEAYLKQFHPTSLLSFLRERSIFESENSTAVSTALAQTYTELINELKSMPTSNGSQYQEFVEKMLRACFADEFDPFHLAIEVSTYHEKRRRDFIIENIGSRSEFWLYLKYNRNVEKVVFDAKNYKEPVRYDEITSTLRYLGNKAFGNFMIFVTRHGLKNYTEVLEDYDREGKIALFLDDADLITMLERKRAGVSASSLVREKYAQFLDMK